MLTPTAATGLAVVMVLAAATHIRRREPSGVAINAVLFALAAVVAWGRFGPYGYRIARAFWKSCWRSVERRRRREGWIKVLNRLMGGIVRIKMLDEDDDTEYLAELSAIARGAQNVGPP